MRKTLVLAAAALTAGLLTASAQNVYSVNIVGYVNTVFKGGGAYTLVANPLDDGNGNQLTNLVNILPNKSSVLVWNGASFEQANKSSGLWSTNYALPPGVGFYVRNVGATDLTNTFVGTVVAGPSTNSFPAAIYKLIGSTVPVGGTLEDTNYGLGQVLPNKSSVLVWDNSGPGAYIQANKSSGAWSTNLAINVGQGAFVRSLTATNWVQTLPPSP